MLSTGNPPGDSAVFVGGACAVRMTLSTFDEVDLVEDAQRDDGQGRPPVPRSCAA